MRSEIACDVKFGGRTESYYDGEGRYRVRRAPEKVVKAVAYDTPVPGYRVHSANLLRLWKAEAAGTASEPPSHRFAISLASSIRPESMASLKAWRASVVNDLSELVTDHAQQHLVRNST